MPLGRPSGLATSSPPGGAPNCFFLFGPHHTSRSWRTTPLDPRSFDRLPLGPLRPVGSRLAGVHPAPPSACGQGVCARSPEDPQHLHEIPTLSTTCPQERAVGDDCRGGATVRRRPRCSQG